VYAVTAGAQEPAYITLANVTERNMLHAYAPGIDVVPPQRPSGAGLQVFAGQVLRQPGYYALTATGADSTWLAINQDRAESSPAYQNIATLQQQWKNANVRWKEIDAAGNISASGPTASFPLWKVCVILALVMLGVETWLLSRRKVAVA
jgi:hypothetical protein